MMASPSQPITSAHEGLLCRFFSEIFSRKFRSTSELFNGALVFSLLETECAPKFDRSLVDTKKIESFWTVCESFLAQRFNETEFRLKTLAPELQGPGFALRQLEILTCSILLEMDVFAKLLERLRGEGLSSTKTEAFASGLFAKILENPPSEEQLMSAPLKKEVICAALGSQTPPLQNSGQVPRSERKLSDVAIEAAQQIRSSETEPRSSVPRADPKSSFSSLKELSEEVEALREQMKLKEQKIRTLTTAKTKLEEQIASYQWMYSGSKQTISVLQERIGDQEKQVTDLRFENSDLRLALEHIRTSRSLEPDSSVQNPSKNSASQLIHQSVDFADEKSAALRSLGASLLEELKLAYSSMTEALLKPVK